MRLSRSVLVGLLALGATSLSTVALPSVTAAAVVADSRVVSTGPAPGSAAGRTSVVALGVDGVDRSYRLFVPTALPAGPRPLLLALHSFTRDGARFERESGLDAGAVKAGALVVYPDGLDQSWNAGGCCVPSSATGVDDVGFLEAVLRDVAARRAVDRVRVSVVGHSNGGMMAYRLGCERSALADTVIVMAGTFVGPSCSFTRPVSLLHVHGALDDIVPVSGLANTPLAVSGFPDVRGPVSAYAAFDRCKGWSTTAFEGSPLASVLQATCPPGTWVQLVVSSTLGHAWPTSADRSRYGVDMTGATWGFARAVWASRGAPVAL